MNLLILSQNSDRQGRWLLEVVFNRYKNDECLDHTDCQGDFSVMGNEFINFLSTVATCRIIRKAGKAGLLDNMSYAELMDDLSSAWRRMDSPTEPATDDGISSRPYLLSWRLLDYPNRFQNQNLRSVGASPN